MDRNIYKCVQCQLQFPLSSLDKRGNVFTCRNCIAYFMKEPKIKEVKEKNEKKRNKTKN